MKSMKFLRMTALALCVVMTASFGMSCRKLETPNESLAEIYTNIDNAATEGFTFRHTFSLAFSVGDWDDDESLNSEDFMYSDAYQFKQILDSFKQSDGSYSVPVTLSGQVSGKDASFKVAFGAGNAATTLLTIVSVNEKLYVNVKDTYNAVKGMAGKLGVVSSNWMPVWPYANEFIEVNELLDMIDASYSENQDIIYGIPSVEYPYDDIDDTTDDVLLAPNASIDGYDIEPTMASNDVLPQATAAPGDDGYMDDGNPLIPMDSHCIVEEELIGISGTVGSFGGIEELMELFIGGEGAKVVSDIVDAIPDETIVEFLTILETALRTANAITTDDGYYTVTMNKEIFKAALPAFAEGFDGKLADMLESFYNAVNPVLPEDYKMFEYDWNLAEEEFITALREGLDDDELDHMFMYDLNFKVGFKTNSESLAVKLNLMADNGEGDAINLGADLTCNVGSVSITEPTNVLTDTELTEFIKTFSSFGFGF